MDRSQSHAQVAAQHGFYAKALRAHLGSLATGHGLGTISRSSGIVRFVQGGVVKTFRCATYRNEILGHRIFHLRL